MKKLFYLVAAMALVFTSCTEEKETIKGIIPQTFSVGVYDNSPALQVSNEMYYYLDGFSKTYTATIFMNPNTKRHIEMSDNDAKAKYDEWQKDICSTLAKKDTAMIMIAIGVGLDGWGSEQIWLNYACNLLDTYTSTKASNLKVLGALKRTNGDDVKSTTFYLK